MDDNEEWRDVPGCEGLYEVSRLGRVRRLTRRNGYFSERLDEPLIIPPKRTGKKYWGVTLAKDGWKKRFYIHHLVLLAFTGPRPGNSEGSHLDGDTSHNEATNLCWESRSQNHLRKRSHGTMIRGERAYNSKLTEAKVRSIRASAESHTVLAERYGVSRSLISLVQRREVWIHVD
jgi:hypothetical protein